MLANVRPVLNCFLLNRFDPNGREKSRGQRAIFF
jgi:hypothetical protein